MDKQTNRLTLGLLLTISFSFRSLDGKWAKISSSLGCLSFHQWVFTWKGANYSEKKKKKVKIKVNELERPPEDNDLCQEEHIVSLQSRKWLHSSGRQSEPDKRTKALSRGAHISHLWRISIRPLDASRTMPSKALGPTLNQKSSVNIHDSMSKHKVLISPTW